MGATCSQQLRIDSWESNKVFVPLRDNPGSAQRPAACFWDTGCGGGGVMKWGVYGPGDEAYIALFSVDDYSVSD